MNQPLAETIFWIAAVACVIAELAILRSTFAARSSHKSTLVPSASPRSEVVWAILPGLALAFLLTATWRRIEAREAHTTPMDHPGMHHSMAAPTSTPQP